MSAPLPSTLVLLVYGLPGAGKTTCVRSAAAVLSGRGYQTSVIELDHWLHGALGPHADGVEAETKRTFDPDDWHSAFDHYLGGIAAALAEHAAERNNGRPRLVFCVDNHYYRSMRWRVMRAVELANDRAEGTTVGFASVLVDAHTGVCLSRNAGRDGVARVPPSVIERMDSRLERGPVKRQPPCTDVTYDATAKSEVPVGLAFANFIEDDYKMSLLRQRGGEARGVRWKVQRPTNKFVHFSHHFLVAFGTVINFEVLLLK